MTIQYRNAKRSDGRAGAKIVSDWAEETPWLGPLNDIETMTVFWGDMLAIETAWVAEEGGSVVGFCVREDDNITGLYIARAARSKGVGKRLLDLAKQDRDWITVWALELNTEARRFYRREGLVEISREIEECGGAAGLMDVEHRWTRSA